MCNFIIHNDADGLVSGILFYYMTKKPFKGFYTLSNFYLSEPFNSSDVAIDLDMQCMKCIGHHISPIDNPKAFNPNKTYLTNKFKEFRSKCPLNTVMLLLDLFHIEVKTLEQLALVVYCDGFYNYYDKYKSNCRNWLNMFNLAYIYEQYEDNREEILRIIHDDIIPISNSTTKQFKASFYNDRMINRQEVHDFVAYVSKVFNLDINPDIFDISFNVSYKYTVRSFNVFNEWEYNDIIERLKQKQQEDPYYIISSALVYHDTLRVTVNEKKSPKF